MCFYNPKPAVQPIKLTGNERIYSRFEYSADGNIQRHVYYPGYGPDSLAGNYRYQNGQLPKVTAPGNDYLSLHYEGNRLARKNVYRSGGVHTYSWEYNKQPHHIIH